VISGIERMHLITHSMCRDILISMKNWDVELARSVVSLEDDVDQLMYFLLRLIRGAAISPSLSNQLGLDMIDCLDFQTLVHRIERIADHATNIANCAIALIESTDGLPEDVMRTLMKSAETAFNSYEGAVNGYLTKNVETTNAIIDTQKDIIELYREITPLPHLGEPYDTSILSNIITIRESIMKISHHVADIAELTIDRAYKFENVNP
jgi:phosphate uptake regulator